MLNSLSKGIKSSKHINIPQTTIKRNTSQINVVFGHLYNNNTYCTLKSTHVPICVRVCVYYYYYYYYYYY